MYWMKNKKFGFQVRKFHNFYRCKSYILCSLYMYVTALHQNNYTYEGIYVHTRAKQKHSGFKNFKV